MYTKNKLKKRIITSFLFFLAFLVFNCQIGTDLLNPANPAVENGTVTIRFSNQVATKMIQPATDLNINSICLKFTHEKNKSLTFNQAFENSLTIDKLLLGKWNIKVYAYNKTNNCIGFAENDITIVGSSVVNVSMNIKPLTGKGSFKLAVSWDPKLVTAPSLQGCLTPLDGTSIDLSFTLTAAEGKANCTSSSIPAGYYAFEIKLLDNGAVVAGRVDSVRILSEQTTNGTIQIDNITTPEGGVNITIGQEMNNPLPVTLNGPLSLRETEIFNANVLLGESIADLRCTWYLDGTKVGSGLTLTLENLVKGYHYLDAIAFTPDGLRSGNATLKFQVYDKNLLKLECLLDDVVFDVIYVEYYPHQVLDYLGIDRPFSDFYSYTLVSGDCVISDRWLYSSEIRMGNGFAHIKVNYVSPTYSFYVIVSSPSRGYPIEMNEYRIKLGQTIPISVTSSFTDEREDGQYTTYTFSRWPNIIGLLIEDPYSPSTKATLISNDFYGGEISPIYVR